jgi:hypothetical protein
MNKEERIRMHSFMLRAQTEVERALIDLRKIVEGLYPVGSDIAFRYKAHSRANPEILTGKVMGYETFSTVLRLKVVRREPKEVMYIVGLNCIRAIDKGE